MTSGDPEQDGGPDAEHPSTPEPDPLDVDSAFAAIIAGWADGPTVGSWPAEEDLAVGRHRRVEDPLDEDGDRRDDGSNDSLNDGRGDGRDGRGDVLDQDSRSVTGAPLLPSLGLPDPDEPAEPEERFIPPDPPPLPRGDVISRLAWAGLIAGPVFLLTTAIVWQSAPELLVMAAVAGFVGGFITLVARMPKHRDDDDDDGAVV